MQYDAEFGKTFHGTAQIKTIECMTKTNYNLTSHTLHMQRKAWQCWGARNGMLSSISSQCIEHVIIRLLCTNLSAAAWSDLSCFCEGCGLDRQTSKTASKFSITSPHHFLRKKSYYTAVTFWLP